MRSCPIPHVPISKRANDCTFSEIVHVSRLGAEYLGYNECGQFLSDRANKLKRRVGHNMTLYEKGKSLFLKLNESVLEPA